MTNGAYAQNQGREAQIGIEEVETEPGSGNQLVFLEQVGDNPFWTRTCFRLSAATGSSGYLDLITCRTLHTTCQPISQFPICKAYHRRLEKSLAFRPHDLLDPDHQPQEDRGIDRRRYRDPSTAAPGQPCLGHKWLCRRPCTLAPVADSRYSSHQRSSHLPVEFWVLFKEPNP